MGSQEFDMTEVLDFLDPACLTYQEWTDVGMGLKESGYAVSVWDRWSSRDTKRYHSGECERKWETFKGNSKPITAGSIVKMALDRGFVSSKDEGHELAWNDIIGSNKDSLIVVNKNWLEDREVAEPANWDPVKDLITYIDTLFESTENVGYVTRSFKREGDEKYTPDRGCYDRTAGQLIQQLSKCGGDIGSVLGDYKPEVGAWIRFNPLDGRGVKNENVTDFRFALVESDNLEIEKQNAIIRELELPVACLVHSGKKSLHAIVRVDAANYEEYRKRVDYLYKVCLKNGLPVDQQNRNPSRLSRMPGVMRNGHKQYLLDTNIGKQSWDEWKEWIESVNDDLPDPESMAAAWDNLPPLAQPLIDGVLRKGHKMLVAGPSKAGKSYALIELCCAIAEGREWLGFGCAQGKVLYVNLELDRASCLHRFKDVYTALDWQPNNLPNIDIWNLRGRSVPMDQLAPKLIRRAAKKNYTAIIIDPIYKVITGDENSADQMAHFCNQFDKVCTELGCAVIYCHHHSKGSQGGKRSMDRASGSGVFARDPDALLDLIELTPTEELIKQEENNAVCRLCVSKMTAEGVVESLSQDDACSATAALRVCEQELGRSKYNELLKEIAQCKADTAAKTAWRIEGTLREFPKFAPINLWFDYPIHRVDDSGALQDIAPEAEQSPWRKAIDKRKPKEKKQSDRKKSIDTAFEACGIDGDVTVKALSEYLGIAERTTRDRIKEHGDYELIGGIVRRKT